MFGKRLSLLGLVLLLLLSIGCFSGDDGEASPTATASPTPTETPTPTASATSAPVLETPSGLGDQLEPISGRHFRGVAPERWLVIDPDRPLGLEQAATFAALSASMREEVLRVQEEAITELVLTGLPLETESRIVISSICEPVWSFGVADWPRAAELGLIQRDELTGPGAGIAIVDGLPYPVLEAAGPLGPNLDVYPVSRDGCTYGISLQAAESVTPVSEFLEFLEGLELGRDSGAVAQGTDPLVPSGWTPLSGRGFNAALAEEWFYNDVTVPLTDTQLVRLSRMSDEVSSNVRSDQELDLIELIYIGLPFEADAKFTVVELCGLSTDYSPSEWAAEAARQKTARGAEVLETGLVVTVDGRELDVYLVEYPDRIDFDVYPNDPEGCGYIFSAKQNEEGPWTLIDFMSFMRTVTLRSSSAEGVEERSLVGRHFNAELPAGWAYFDAESSLSADEEALISSLPSGVADEVRDDLLSNVGMQFVYMRLPSDAVVRVYVTVSCGYPDLTLEAWEEVNIQVVQQRDWTGVTNGDLVTIDGQRYDVWEIRRDGELDRVVMPLSGDGCAYTFQLFADESDAGAYSDFLAFLETATLTGSQSGGG